MSSGRGENVRIGLVRYSLPFIPPGARQTDTFSPSLRRFLAPRNVSGSGRIPLRKDRYVIVFERYDNTPATVQYSESEQPGRIGNSRRGMPEFSARVHLIDLIVDQRFAGNVEQGTGPGSEILPFSDLGRSERRVLHPIVNTR